MIVSPFLVHQRAARTGVPVVALLTLKAAGVVAMPSVSSERFNGMRVIAGILSSPYSR
jgi:hypothetical protein